MTNSARLFHNGVNLQPSYYNNGEVTFGWDLMKAADKIKTVRIEIEPGREIQARSWIQQACGQGYQVIATYHKYRVLGRDEPGHLQAAADWWRTNYSNLVAGPVTYRVQAGDTLSLLAGRFYGDIMCYDRIYRQNRHILPDADTVRTGQVITIPALNRSFTVNLMNEWGSHALPARDYAQAYNAAIATLRSVYRGKVIIDVPGWGQETAVAASAIKAYRTGGVRITDPDVVLSVHIYAQAYVRQKTANGPSGPMVPADLDDLASADRPCIVGEFGPGDPSGNADWSALVDHAKRLGWPLLGWAWNGDGEPWYMNMVTPDWPTNANPPTLARSPYFRTVYDKL